MAHPKKAKAEDLDFQMAFYEAILKDNPDFFDALMALGEIYTKRGFYAKGLDVDKKLLTLRPDNPIVHYNLACSLSLTGDIPASFKAIKRAITLGYDDLSFMERDPDLANLRRSRRFEELMKEINARQPLNRNNAK